MPQTPRAAGRLALAALLALAGITCTDQPTEPGAAHLARVRVVPTFAAGTFATGLPLDNVTVTVVRPAAETLLVKNAPFAATDSTVQLDLPVTLNAPSESLEVTVDLLSGSTLLFRGVDTVLVTSGAPTAPTVALQYVGPGSDIASIVIGPRDSVLAFSATLKFGVTAIDSSDAAVPNFYVHWWTGTAGVGITPDGAVTAPALRSTVWVHAKTPTGIEDSTRVTFVPVPTLVLKVSGDLQIDTVRDTLPLPLVVEVRAADNLPVQGVPVTFAATTVNGSITPTSAITDSLGRASATAVLGDSAKIYTYSATVAGVTPVFFNATGGHGPPTLIAKVSGDLQSDTAGQALGNPMVVQVADAQGNPVPLAPVIWTRIAGTGTPAVDTVNTNGAGKSQFLYTLGSPGVDTIRAQIAGTGAFVDFTVITILGGTQIVLVNGDSQVDTVARALAESLIVEVQPAGGGAGVAGVPVLWAVTAGLGHASLDTSTTDSLGRSAVAFTFDTLAGPVTVQLVATGAAAPAVFHLTAVSQLPHHLAYAVAIQDTQRIGVAFTPQPTIQVRDTFNNPVLLAGVTVQAITDWSLGAPKPPAGGSAPNRAPGLQLSASVGGIDSAVTDSLGRAAFSGLFLTGAVGAEVLNYRMTGPYPSTFLSDSLFVQAGLPTSVVVFDGAGQSTFIDSLLPVAPEVLVMDTSGNPVSGVTVAFVVTAGGGTVTGDTVVTDSLGLARVGSWRLGAVPGANTLEARVTGLTPAIFTATATPLTPTIQLTLLNTNVVGVGRTALLEVRLSAPAPGGGADIDLASDAPGIVSLALPFLHYNAGDSVLVDTLNGVAAGVANIVASGSGYDPDTLAVTGSLNLISLPTTLNVPYGSNTSIAVSLGLPAPAGGVVVTLTSSDSTLVGIVTPTVNIPAGQTSANGTVHGTALGTATVTASNPNYAPDQSLVSTTASLNITVPTLSAFSTFGAVFTTEFRSNGILTSAPLGGIPVTLTSRDPSCVTTAPSVTIPQGQTSRTDSLGYGGGAALPCVTYLVATSAGIDPDSVQVTIQIPPALTINFATTTIGSGMQDGAFNVNLATGAHGGRTLTVRTLTPSIVKIQPDGVTTGTDSITTFIPNGTVNSGFYLGAMEGIVNDSGYIETTMPGFRPDTGKVYVRQGAIDLQGIPASMNELATNANIYVQMGVPNLAQTTMQAYQGPRAGGSMARLATVTSNSGIVAGLKDSSATVDSVGVVTFPIGQYYTPLSGPPTGLQVDPLAVGGVTFTASVPGLIPLSTASRDMTVTQAAVTLNNTVLEIGAGLQDGNYGLNLSGPNHGGQTVTLKVATSGIGLIQPNGTTAGTDSLQLVIPNGQTSASFYLAGVEGVSNDSVLVIATVPGYVSDTLKLRVRTPAIDLQGIPASLNSLAANANFYVQIGIPNLAVTTMNAYQGPRFGGTMARTATVTVTPGTVATLHDAGALPDTIKSVDFPVGQYYTPLSGPPTGLSIDPLAPGLATVVAAFPGAVQLATATRTLTVTGTQLTFNNTVVEIGSGLQDGSYGLNLNASAHGGVTVKLKMLTTGVAVLQPNGTTAGTDSLMIFVPNGTATTSFFLGGLEGIVNDSAQVEASVPGFGSDTLLVRVRRPSLDLQGVPASTTTLSPNTPIYAQMGIANLAHTAMNAYQGTRAGQPAESLWVVSRSPTVARIANSSVTGDSLAVVFPVGQYYTPLSVAGGGLALDPLTTGTDTITLSHPIFTNLANATRAMDVVTPGISVGGGTVGAGLQRQQSFTLGASQHGGVSVVVKSSAPGVMKISPNSTTPGTDSIVVFIPNGQQSSGFYVQGMDSMTGSPTVQVSAPGFSDGSAAETVVLPAIDLQGVPTSISAGAASTLIYAQIGVPNGALTTMNEYEEPRAGGHAPITVTFNNSAFLVANLQTSLLPASQSVTANIAAGLYYTPLSLAGGGVNFDPFSTGSTTVSVSATGFIALPNATRTVNVTP